MCNVCLHMMFLSDLQGGSNIVLPQLISSRHCHVRLQMGFGLEPSSLADFAQSDVLHRRLGRLHFAHHLVSRCLLFEKKYIAWSMRVDSNNKSHTHTRIMQTFYISTRTASSKSCA